MALFLTLGVLAPTACVLWFMNEAARSQAVAARQEVAEAYRGQLKLLREKIELSWEDRAAALDKGRGSPADFARAVRNGLADSVVYFAANGSVAYPLAMTPAPAAEGSEARREQARIRGLVQSGDREGALQEIQRNFWSGPLARAVDPLGRLIGADEQLLSLQLMKPGQRRYAAALTRLTALLNDYSGASMPSAQRLFLMDQVRALSPAADLPTYAAEKLAAQFLESDGARPGEAALQETRIPGVWRLSAKNGRAEALFRSESITSSTLIPPGATPPGEAIAAGPRLPGWQISLAALDTRSFDAAARRRMAAYLWTGFLMIAALVITGVLMAHFFRRQARLARLKTDLVAAVSHELKTPLASMRLLVDSLLEDAALDPVKTRDYLQLIAGENLRLTRLIENFLTFSRIERNRQRFEFAETDPAGVVGSAVEAMRERWPLPAGQMQVEVSAELPRLRADGDALVTVLLNLLDNAYKYTPADKRIALHAYREDGHVVFAVEDNGIGIAPRDQKRIFRRFYQVDRRLARETGGVGLGLSIVDFIVRAHGGAVRVKSHTGSGSTFSVWLPCREF